MSIYVPQRYGSSQKFVRIDAAHCPSCGPKTDFLLKTSRHPEGQRYPLPVTLKAEVVERSPWICGDCQARYDVRRRLELDVEVVE